ncbi:ArsR/SmtB family transcription factor [Pseudorhodobacter ferrugineus]|uniref:ArsR/SmtB family transcription factor n=1 Tax=Pseudorhodobacter ferrugineus TaxID=77008 RepID=UPI0003B431DA|nr:metalloregulator ArsR/SmtB family transcription factor [Pseudorhodobacter ferrugineus]
MPVAASPLSDTADRKVADLAKALAHPARLRILRLLLATPGCIGGDIVDAVGLAQSTVSEHLRILKAAGVISGEISGPRVCYALNPDALALLADFVASLKVPDSALCCIPNPKAAP